MFILAWKKFYQGNDTKQFTAVLYVELGISIFRTAFFCNVLILCNMHTNSFIIRNTMKTYILSVSGNVLIFQCFSLSRAALPRLLAEETHSTETFLFVYPWMRYILLVCYRQSDNLTVFIVGWALTKSFMREF